MDEVEPIALASMFIKRGSTLGGAGILCPDLGRQPHAILTRVVTIPGQSRPIRDVRGISPGSPCAWDRFTWAAVGYRCQRERPTSNLTMEMFIVLPRKGLQEAYAALVLQSLVSVLHLPKSHANRLQR